MYWAKTSQRSGFRDGRNTEADSTGFHRIGSHVHLTHLWRPIALFDESTRKFLQSFGFEEETFEALRRSLIEGERRNERIKGEVKAKPNGEFFRLPPSGSAERAHLTEEGERAIREGRVGAVILAGGMATRFGGVVKAGVEALRGESFLGLKLRDLRILAERLETELPIFIMSSFATHKEVEALGKRYETDRTPVHVFPQFVSVRLEENGEIARDEDGKPMFYAPGHGDLSFALRRSGLLERFISGGGELLFMSNVDNLVATLDPAIVGFHLERQKPITVEVAEKYPGDQGGAPALVDGRLEIVESFRFPESFDQDRIGVFNTNTFLLEARAIDRDFPLDYFRVVKKVDGRPVIQFERLVGQLTAFLDTECVIVEREGADARFLPIKTPEDLKTVGPKVEEALVARGALDPA